MKSRHILFLILCLNLRLQAQDIKSLSIGDQAPDFQLNGVVNFYKNKARLQDFKGKWLVLEFWTRACVACIQGFPKFEELAREFEGRAQFVLIGDNSQKYNKGIESLYQRIAQSSNLELTAGYDSLVFAHYQVSSTPHVVIIDPAGKVKVITYGTELNAQKLQALLQGKAANWVTKPGTIVDRPVESKRIMLRTIRIVADCKSILHESTIRDWQSPNPIQINLKLDLQHLIDQYSTTCTSLKRLYLMAYLGTAEWDCQDSIYLNVWKTPILELRDSSKFQQDFLRAIGLYNYSIQFKQSQDKTAAMSAIQTDLEYLFGYDCVLEERNMPYYKLVRSETKKRFRKSTSPKQVKGDPSGYVFKGIHLSDLVRLLDYYYPEKVFIDQTGITDLIDFQLQADMTNLNAIQTGLKAMGLELIVEARKFQVLVIRDSEARKVMQESIFLKTEN